MRLTQMSWRSRRHLTARVQVRALLDSNKTGFAKIFDVYTRRSGKMELDSWLQFAADFDIRCVHAFPPKTKKGIRQLTDRARRLALSTSVLSTIFRGAAVVSATFCVH